MELVLQSLFGLHVHSCTHWLRSLNPPPPPTRALLVSKDGRHLFVTLCHPSRKQEEEFTVDVLFRKGTAGMVFGRRCNSPPLRQRWCNWLPFNSVITIYALVSFSFQSVWSIRRNCNSFADFRLHCAIELSPLFRSCRSKLKYLVRYSSNN